MQTTEVTAAQMLAEMTESYQRKVLAGAALIVQIEIAPGPQKWHVVVGTGDSVALAPGDHPGARVTLTLTEEVLRQIYAGQMTALTAAGRRQLSDPAPLDFRLGPGQTLTSDLYAEIMNFIQRFFNRFQPERIQLGMAHARTLHGAHAVPLFYHPGCRSAWYYLQAGEHLNTTGETNPFPQGLILVSGQGRAKIGENTLEVRSGEAYYIPPDADHVVWADDEAIELIWLAWGPDA